MANATQIIPFFASTQGQGIKVVATSTPGTLVHTGGISASIVDRIYLSAYCAHTADVLLTVEFGGATAPDQNIAVTLPAQSAVKYGLIEVCAGLPLLGNGTVALTVKAFAGTTNVVIVYGYVLRVTP